MALSSRSGLPPGGNGNAVGHDARDVSIVFELEFFVAMAKMLDRLRAAAAVVPRAFASRSSSSKILLRMARYGTGLGGSDESVSSLVMPKMEVGCGGKRDGQDGEEEEDEAVPALIDDGGVMIFYQSVR